MNKIMIRFQVPSGQWFMLEVGLGALLPRETLPTERDDERAVYDVHAAEVTWSILDRLKRG